MDCELYISILFGVSMSYDEYTYEMYASVMTVKSSVVARLKSNHSKHDKGTHKRTTNNVQNDANDDGHSGVRACLLR